MKVQHNVGQIRQSQSEVLMGIDYYEVCQSGNIQTNKLQSKLLNS